MNLPNAAPADEPKINDVAKDFEALGAEVTAIEAYLSTCEGVDAMYASLHGRSTDAL
jgi:hypothetical protein